MQKIQENREDIMQLPTDHNGAPPLRLCSTRHIAPPNEVE